MIYYYYYKAGRYYKHAIAQILANTMLTLLTLYVGICSRVINKHFLLEYK